MEKLIIFGILSIVNLFLSKKNIFRFKTHGFYRFLSWECIAWLVASNWKYWLTNPFGSLQIVSWILLGLALYLIFAAIYQFRKFGIKDKSRKDPALFNFEKTSKLIDTGIFKWIRHPMYSSLLFLGWGIYFKNPSVTLFIVAFVSGIFLYLTAKADENECIIYFGNKYVSYMKNTRMFIPLIF